MDYARFASATALSRSLKTVAPQSTYCTLANAVVVFDELPDRFAAVCAQHGGLLHRRTVSWADSSPQP